MADPVDIAQTGVDPISGSYLSAERRKAIFRSTRVSSFSGGDGGGGALVVRPQTSLVDATQNFQIKLTQQSISSLRQSIEYYEDQIKRVQVQVLQNQTSFSKALKDQAESNNNLVLNLQKTIGSLQTETETLKEQLSSVNLGLAKLYKQIKDDDDLEQREKLNQIQNERILNERKIRIGRENQLEQRIQNSLLKPAAAVQEKVQNIFNRILDALGYMFLGWLTNQGIEALKASASGNKTKLQEIFDNVVSGVTLAGRGFLLVGRTFGSITRTIVGITGGILRLTGGLIGGLFRGIGKLGEMAGSGVRSLLGMGGGAASTASRAASGAAREGGGFLGNLSRIIKTPFKLGGTLLTGLGSGLDFKSAYDNFKSGDMSGAVYAGGAGLLNLASLRFPGLRPFGLAASGFSLTHDLLTNSSTNNPEPTPSKPGAYPETKPPKNNQPQTPAAPAPAPPPPAVQPQTTAMPAPISPEIEKKLQMAWDNRDNPFARGKIESTWNKATPEQQQQAQDWAKSKGYDWSKMRLKSKEVAIQSPNKPAASLAPLPEPKPNVIVTAPPSANTQMPAAQQVSPAGDTPLIQSSNPANFYTLYSQLNYNVVM